MRIELALTLVLAATACTSPAPEPPKVEAQDYVSVAGMSGVDSIGHTHVTNLLAREGIDSYCEGSVFYGVFVQPKNETRAIRILREEAARNEHGIFFEPGTPRLTPTAAGPDWKELDTRGPYADVVKRTDLPIEVRALLLDERVTGRIDSFPYVYRVRVFPRRYLDWDGVTRTGYDAELEMSADPKAELGLYHITYQVLAGGKDVTSAGSSRWGGLEQAR